MKYTYTRRIVFILLLCFSIAGLRAQEYPIYNQYYFNYYLVNPALAGANDCHYFMLTHKQQWVGIDDAPYTTSISYQGRLKHNVGIGAYFYNDKNGYSTQQAGQVSVAYHIPLSTGARYKKAINRDRQLSFAVSAKLFNYGYDGDELYEEATGDKAMEDLSSVLAFNANFGVYYTSYGFFTGLSLTNLVSTKMPNYEADLEPIIPFSGFFLLGNEFEIGQDEALEPSLMYKFTAEGEMALDLSFKYSRASRKNSDFSYWLQLTYRQNIDEGEYQAIDILPMAGFQFGKFHIAAAYDIALNRIWRHNYGSLELMLGYTLCYTKRFCR